MEEIPVSDYPKVKKREDVDRGLNNLKTVIENWKERFYIYNKKAEVNEHKIMMKIDLKRYVIIINGDDPLLVTEAVQESRNILNTIELMDFPLDWVRIP